MSSAANLTAGDAEEGEMGRKEDAEIGKRCVLCGCSSSIQETTSALLRELQPWVW